MFFRRILPKIAAQWLIKFDRAARKLGSNVFQYYRNSNTRLSTAASGQVHHPVRRRWDDSV